MRQDSKWRASTDLRCIILSVPNPHCYEYKRVHRRSVLSGTVHDKRWVTVQGRNVLPETYLLTVRWMVQWARDLRQIMTASSKTLTTKGVGLIACGGNDHRKAGTVWNPVKARTRKRVSTDSQNKKDVRHPTRNKKNDQTEVPISSKNDDNQTVKNSRINRIRISRHYQGQETFLSSNTRTTR